jgi:hypothetical protein
MSDSIKLNSVTLDCRDPGELAAFYGDITGGEIKFQNDKFATAGTLRTPARTVSLSV